MKILRIFGIVLAVHAFAFILIFVNPGCSTKSKPAPAPVASDTQAAGGPSISVPNNSGGADASPFKPAPITDKAADSTGISFDPNAPATAGVRFTPTRPHSPAATALQSEPVADVTPAKTVTVAKGDSLWSIARKNGVSYTELAAVNNLKPSSRIQPGQKLIVPTKAGAAAPARTEATTNGAKAAAPAKASSKKTESGAKAAASGNSVRHTVKPGEMLSTIARKYGVKVGDLAEANAITNPAMVRAGQELVIPGWQAPKSSAAPASQETAKATGTAAAAAPAASSTMPVMPQIGVPPPDQDLDAGLNKQPAATKIPVIRVDDEPSANAPVPVDTPAPKN